MANLKRHYFQPSLSVCVSDRHFYPPMLTDFDETWFQGPYSDLVWPRPYWSRSAAEGRHDAFLKIRKKSEKSQFEFQNSGPSFFCVCVSCVLWKKFVSIQTKLTEEIHFEVCPYRHNASMDPRPMLCARRKHHVLRHARSTADDPVCGKVWHRRAANRYVLGTRNWARRSAGIPNWGHSDLGAQSGRKNQPACFLFIWSNSCN